MIKYWKPTLVALIILYASVTSSENINKIDFFHFEHADKLVHFIFYFTLSTSLFASLFKNTAFKKNKQIVFSLFFSIIYGLIIEFIQYKFTATRAAEFFDFISNTLGAITGVVIFPIWVRLKLVKYL